MKRFLYLSFTFICIFSSTTVAQTSKQKVAVYVTGDAENGYKKVLGSKLVTGITRSEGYAAVERTADFLAELAKEHDYQMSGAVSDNQIARLGQQFGVRYVMVADVSEVFESMFISARMIDVQTAQITNSTEADAVVENMESLSKISETIVLRLFYAKEYAKDEIKIIGPFSTVKELHMCEYDEVPENYHIATRDEIEKIINNNQILNKKTSFPIYAEIKTLEFRHREYFYMHLDKDTKASIPHPYSEYRMTCLFIAIPNCYETKTFSYVDDSMYNSLYTGSITDGCGATGLYNHDSNPSITSGYVYLIKSEE